MHDGRVFLARQHHHAKPRLPLMHLRDVAHAVCAGHAEVDDRQVQIGRHAVEQLLHAQRLHEADLRRQLGQFFSHGFQDEAVVVGDEDFHGVTARLMRPSGGRGTTLTINGLNTRIKAPGTGQKT